MIFSILNNPLTKLAVGKVTDHFKHKAEKVKTIRAAEIEAAKDVDITSLLSRLNVVPIISKFNFWRSSL